MKKQIAILMILMVSTICLMAAAEDKPLKEEIPVLGITFTYPQAMIGTRGMISTGYTAPWGDGIYADYWYYSAVTEEEYQRISEEEPEKMQERTAILFYVFAVAEDRDFSAVSKLTGDSMDPDKAVLIGRVDSWSFYLYMAEDEGLSQTVEKEFGDEYTALISMKDEVAAAFTFTVPFNEYGEMDGKVISFMATDLNGNVIPSDEIFAQHEVTMVNIWATWCGPCIDELAELQAIHTGFQEKDCAVLGLLTDTDTEAACSLMEENGVTYQVVMAPESFGNVFPYDAVPTSFFVDRNGAFLGTKIVGAQPDLYIDALEPLLNK